MPLIKIILVGFLATLAVSAEPVETSLEWEPACDGSSIDVISEGGKIHSVRAFAAHSMVFREWTIHYAEGKPITAEYRERARGKIQEGERAGEDNGENPLTRILTFKAIDGKFIVPDKKVSDDLTDVMAKAKTDGE